MSLEEINSKLITDAVAHGEVEIPTPEELKAKFDQPFKSKYIPWVASGKGWLDYKPHKKPTFKQQMADFEEVIKEESLLESLFAIIKSKLKGDHLQIN